MEKKCNKNYKVLLMPIKLKMDSSNALIIMEKSICHNFMGTEDYHPVQSQTQSGWSDHEAWNVCGFADASILGLKSDFWAPGSLVA